GGAGAGRIDIPSFERRLPPQTLPPVTTLVGVEHSGTPVRADRLRRSDRQHRVTLRGNRMPLYCESHTYETLTGLTGRTYGFQCCQSRNAVFATAGEAERARAAKSTIATAGSAKRLTRSRTPARSARAHARITAPRQSS